MNDIQSINDMIPKSRHVNINIVYDIIVAVEKGKTQDVIDIMDAIIDMKLEEKAGRKERDSR